jgi:uncharacterized protein (DUF2132 family)
MSTKTTKDPLHGKTLQIILEELQAKYGWEILGREIRINCFHVNPSINSSLKFLRRTPWARAKVEEMYLKHLSGTFNATDPNV